MKTKFIQPPREFGFAGDTFNLAGETLRQPETKPQPRVDLTREMFLDHAAIELGRAVLAGEMKLEC
jgi:hypothetical protein